MVNMEGGNLPMKQNIDCQEKKKGLLDFHN